MLYHVIVLLCYSIVYIALSCAGMSRAQDRADASPRRMLPSRAVRHYMFLHKPIALCY